MIKDFSVDMDDPSDLKKYITLLQKRRKNVLKKLGYEQISFVGSKTSVHMVMPLFEQILNHNLIGLYPDLDSSEKYYVYVHCDPTSPLKVRSDIKDLFLATNYNLAFKPIYVGKGEGDRFLDLNRNDSHRKIRTNLRNKNTDLIPIKIADNLTEAEALSLESKMIDILGLNSLSKEGLLCNLDEGKNPKERRMSYPKECLVILKKNGFLV